MNHVGRDLPQTIQLVARSQFNLWTFEGLQNGETFFLPAAFHPLYES
jgi:hypothetical protein